jgi:hypothetical protein
MRRRAVIAALAWILSCAGIVAHDPRLLRTWIDLVDAARGGPSAWGAAAEWGLRSRWEGDAGPDRQHAPDGCGAAALHALLQQHRPRPTQDLLWSVCRAPRGGATLGRLAWAARRFGCACEVIWSRDLGAVRPPAIVHLARGHFVVLERCDPAHAWLLDPACGRLRVPLVTLQRRASGAALQLVGPATLPPSSQVRSP